MDTKTDVSRSAYAARHDALPQAKSRLALFVATAGGLSYLPKAPGTWGSLAGVFMFAVVQFYSPLDHRPGIHPGIGARIGWATLTALPIAIAIAAAGVWGSNRAAQYWGQKDPQFVVIDEVSGQHLTYLLALAPVNWKYLLLGFILFRFFDIWKPFPARQAESLPGGWGIMADDWIAGVYAATGLWIAGAFGL
jgi:phosphatidylglycerophosphatase A